MRKTWFKVIFSIAIIIASIPSVVTDIREGFSGTYTHYGTLLIGISYLIESLFWVLEMWMADISRAINESLIGYDRFEDDVNQWGKELDSKPGWDDSNEGKTYNKDAWLKEWERTNDNIL